MGYAFGLFKYIVGFFFSIAGLVVLGIMPATAATFSVTRKWVTGNTDIPIFPNILEGI
ncbi:hypothetical protein GCM10020331_075920 [Ectobacillus funiculus]